MALGVLGLFDTVIPGFHPDFHHYVALVVGVIGLGVVSAPGSVDREVWSFSVSS